VAGGRGRNSARLMDVIQLFFSILLTRVLVPTPPRTIPIVIICRINLKIMVAAGRFGNHRGGRSRGGGGRGRRRGGRQARGAYSRFDSSRVEEDDGLVIFIIFILSILLPYIIFILTKIPGIQTLK
jgi:hypothetical protein